jgi:hypothetical protein
MTRPVGRTVRATAGLVILAVVIVGLRPGGVELRVTDLESDTALVVLPLRPGERFTLHYVHSVENAPIWEDHSVDENGRIFIEEERYLKFGAGMGRMPGVGRMVMKGPYEAIVDMHQPTGDFVLRVGSPGVDHTLIWRDVHTNLSAIAAHQAVQFSAHPVKLWYRLWRRVWPHPATPVPAGK